MTLQKLNTTSLRERVRKICEDANNYMLSSFKKTDIDNVLKKWGYIYDYDIKTGNFSITAAPGFLIKAVFGSVLPEQYLITVEINYGGCSVRCNDLSSQLLIHPLNIEILKPVFDQLVSDLQKTYDECEAMTKDDKGAKLLSLMIRPIIRKNKVPGVKVVRCNEDPAQFWIVKQISPKGYIRAKINFSEYEKKCEMLAKAFRCFPEWLPYADGLHYSLGKPYYTYYPLPKIRSGQGVVEPIEGLKMKYADPVGNERQTNCDEGDSTSDLSNILEELGFKYRIEDRSYAIFINSDIILIRNGVSFWFKQKSTGLSSGAFILRDGEFAKMLELIALGAIENQGYCYNTLPEDGCYRFLDRALQKSLPKHFYYHIGSNSILIHNQEEFYCIDLKSSMSMTILWEVIKTVNSGKPVFSYSEFPDFEVRCK